MPAVEGVMKSRPKLVKKNKVVRGEPASAFNALRGGKNLTLPREGKRGIGGRPSNP